MTVLKKLLTCPFVSHLYFAQKHSAGQGSKNFLGMSLVNSK
jgi:hypothetical protein